MTRKNINSSLRRFSTRFSFFDYFFVTFIFLSLTPIVFTLVGIDVAWSKYFIAIVILFLLILLVYKLSTLKDVKGFIHRNRLYLLVTTAALLFSFFGKFLSLISFEVPILHDPYSHAKWIKMILTEGEVSYFYSPLLHTTIVSIHYLTDLSTTKLIIIMHSLLSFSIPILYGYVSYVLLKRRFVSLSLFLILSAIFFPFELYYLAGKNALVMGLFLLPITLYYLNQLLTHKHRKALNGILFTLSIIALFLAHYPLFISISLFIIPGIAYRQLMELKRREYRNSAILILILAIAILFIVAWLMPRYSIHFGAERVAPQVAEDLVTGSIGRDLLNAFRDSYEYLTGAFLFFGLITVIVTFNSRFNTIERFTYLSTFLLLLLLEPIGNIFRPESFSILIQTYSIIRPFLVTILVSNALLSLYFFQNPTRRQKSMILILLLTFVFFTNIYLFYFSRRYHNQASVIDQNDLEVFSRINEELPEECTILNSAKVDQNRANVVFPTDGGLWIPIFTQCENTSDFFTFDNPDTHKYASIVQEMIDQTDDKEAVAQLLDEGVRYIYVDSDSLLKKEFLNNTDFEVLYQSGDTYLIELGGVDEQ